MEEWVLVQNQNEFKTWVNVKNILKNDKNYNLQKSIGNTM